MRSPRTILLGVLASLSLACSSAPQPPPVVKIAPSPTPTEAPSAAPAVDPDSDPIMPDLAAWKAPVRTTDTPACKKIDAAQDAASRKNASVPDGGLSSGDFVPTPCLPQKGGAWGLIGTVVDWENMPPISPGTAYCGREDTNPCVFNPTVSLVPVHVSDSGVEKRGAPIVTTLMGGGLGEQEVGAFDLDGDGVEELILAVGDGVVLEFKKDAISPYSKAKALVFDRIVDFDQDGRPDLLLRNPYVGSFLGCGFRGGFPVMNFGADIEVVARSLSDGTFSAADPAAQAITKQQCPVPPRRVVVKGEGGAIDNLKLRQNIACARLWGVTEQALEKLLAKDCTWPSPDDDECQPLFDIRDGQSVTTCAGKDVLLGWLKAPAPVTLQ